MMTVCGANRHGCEDLCVRAHLSAAEAAAEAAARCRRRLTANVAHLETRTTIRPYLLHASVQAHYRGTPRCVREHQEVSRRGVDRQYWLCR